MGIRTISVLSPLEEQNIPTLQNLHLESPRFSRGAGALLQLHPICCEAERVGLLCGVSGPAVACLRLVGLGFHLLSSHTGDCKNSHRSSEYESNAEDKCHIPKDVTIDETKCSGQELWVSTGVFSTGISCLYVYQLVFKNTNPDATSLHLNKKIHIKTVFSLMLCGNCKLF